MALERVLMWDNSKGWTQISAETAAELCCYEKVQARSGIFMCGKCHKYVFFSNGKARGRYFGHSRGDEDKECEDRAQYYDEGYDAFKDPKYCFKISYTRTRFSFNIGLSLPSENLAEGSFKITSSMSNFTYNFSRFEGCTFQYFDVGEIPATEYEIITDRINIPTFPKKVVGINNRFAIFKADSGKRLPEWANVQVNTEYLLLYKGQFTNPESTSVTRRLILEKNGYSLLRIVAERFDQSARDFFYRLRCILTTECPEIYPVWPMYRRTPYIMQHDSNKIFLLLRGDEVEPKLFPSRNFDFNLLEESNSIITAIGSGNKNRQQILALNKNNPRLKQLIIWGGSAPRAVKTPNVVITDINGNEFFEVINYELPHKNELRIKAEYNGFVLRLKNNVLYEKYTIKSGATITLYRVEYGEKFEIYQGSDKIKAVEFARKPINTNFDDRVFAKKLSQCSCNMISIPYDLSGLVSRLKIYPITQGRLRKIIRKGYISEKAFKLLKKLVLELEDKND